MVHALMPLGSAEPESTMTRHHFKLRTGYRQPARQNSRLARISHRRSSRGRRDAAV